MPGFESLPPELLAEIAMRLTLSNPLILLVHYVPCLSQTLRASAREALGHVKELFLSGMRIDDAVLTKVADHCIIDGGMGHSFRCSVSMAPGFVTATSPRG